MTGLRAAATVSSKGQSLALQEATLMISMP